MRRTPPGVRELKLLIGKIYFPMPRRTPPGVRELKLFFAQTKEKKKTSHPSRGA